MKAIFLLSLLLFGSTAFANISQTEFDVKVVKHSLDVADIADNCLQLLEEKPWGFICRVETSEKAFATPFTLLKQISARSFSRKVKGVFSEVSLQFSGLNRKSFDPKSNYVSYFSIVIDKRDLRNTATKEEAAKIIREIIATENPNLFTYYQVVR